MAAGSITAEDIISNAYNKSLDDLVEKGDHHYEKGEYDQAVACYAKVAGENYPKGWSALARVYHEGLAIPKDEIEVKRLFDLIEVSANSGNSVGQSRLGYMYLFGYGIARNDQKSFEWTHRSAEQGDPVGQYNLGISYEAGISVDKDVHKAAEWYSLSSRKGYEKATKALNILLDKNNAFKVTLAGVEQLDLNKDKNENTENKALHELKSDYNSDDELSEIEKSYSITFFSRTEKISAIATTIPCSGGNIKGNTLIKKVHDHVQDWLKEVIDAACEPEKYEEGIFTIIPAPKTENLSLEITAPREWFMCLGGWKGMMPNQEVQDYFFFQPPLQKEKFDSVKIFDSIKFIIKDHRIHFPNNFFIGNFDVTQHWKKSENGRWEKHFGKTDLSYKQILNAIEHIKKIHSINDSQIAQLQLCCLSRSINNPDWTAAINPEELKQVITFLDYLNALMFGIEASGLNAALLISAMMLDLIAENQYLYKDAFSANNDGGIYPYACFGDNRGTYTERERTMLSNPPSMHILRNDPKRSPVAIKEAIIIKVWLRHVKVLDTKLTYSEQLKSIDHAIKDLSTFYFSPWCRHSYLIEKFKVSPAHNHADDIYCTNSTVIPVVCTK